MIFHYTKYHQCYFEKISKYIVFSSFIGFRLFQTHCTVLCLCLPIETTWNWVFLSETGEKLRLCFWKMIWNRVFNIKKSWFMTVFIWIFIKKDLNIKFKLVLFRELSFSYCILSYCIISYRIILNHILSVSCTNFTISLMPDAFLWNGENSLKYSIGRKSIRLRNLDWPCCDRMAPCLPEWIACRIIDFRFLRALIL